MISSGPYLGNRCTKDFNFEGACMYTSKYMCIYIDMNIHRGPGSKKRRWTSAIYRKCGGPMACNEVSGLIWGWGFKAHLDPESS